MCIPQGLTPEAAAKQWLRGTDGLSYRMRGVHAYENLLEIPEDKRLVELDHDTFQWRPRKGVESNEIDQAISQYVKAWRQQENPVDVSTSESVVKRKSAIDIAKEQIQNLCNSFKKDPQQYVEYLKFSARFYKYSGRNMMLIYQQKPGANFVASRTAFKDMGYDLKPGQWRHPAWIIRPETKTLFVTADGVVADIKSATVQEKADIQDGKIPTEKFTYFRAAKVYEIGQTTCPAKDYPKILGHGIDDQQHKELYTRLQAVAGMSGFIVSEEPLPSGEFGYCSYNKQIVISDSLGDTQKLATLNHEFAHGLLHLALCRLLHLHQVRVQAPVQEHRVVQHWAMVFQVRPAQPAVLAQRGLRLMHGQVREKIIPGLRVVQIAAHIHAGSFHCFGGEWWFLRCAQFGVRPPGSCR